jgi:hypothetical protein
MKNASRRVAVITESHNTRWQCLKAFSKENQVLRKDVMQRDTHHPHK